MKKFYIMLCLFFSLLLPMSVQAAPKLSKSKATIGVGEQLQLKVKNNKKKVKWTSSNKKIATVSSKGKVKGKKKGKATITAKIGKKKLKCKITVIKKVKVKRLYLKDIPAYDLEVGETFTMKTSVSPSNATNKKVKWTSSNPSVASVDSNGKVHCKSAGNVTITVATTDGSKIKVSQTFKIKKHNQIQVTDIVEDEPEPSTPSTPSTIPVSSMNISGIPKGTLEIGQSFTLKATISPANATNKTVVWKSSNTSLASINQNGEVKCLKGGTFTITATASNGLSWKRSFTISSQIKASQIQLSGIPVGDLTVGEYFTMKALVLPENATNKTLRWTSSNPSVASIDSNGKVDCLQEGSFVITVSTTDGSNLSMKKDFVVKKKETEETTSSTGQSGESQSGGSESSGGGQSGGSSGSNEENPKPTENIPVKSFTISKIPRGNLHIGQEFTLETTIYPENATNKTIVWKSSNTDVATVVNGHVVCKSIGETTISAMLSNGGIWKRTFTVDNTIKVSSISLSSIPAGYLYVGEEYQLSATVSPENASNKNLNWTSSNPGLASIENGKIKCLREGDVTITVSPADGSNVQIMHTFHIEKEKHILEPEITITTP